MGEGDDVSVAMGDVGKPHMVDRDPNGLNDSVQVCHFRLSK